MAIVELHRLEEMLPYFPLLQQLNPKLSRDTYIERLTTMLRLGNYFQIVCLNDKDEALGLTGIWIGTKIWCGKYLELDNFIVDQSHRSAGIGKQLLNWAEARARQEECRMMCLDTYATLHQAHRFYISNGFQLTGYHMTRDL